MTEGALAEVKEELQRFVRTRTDALNLAAAESKARKQKLQMSIAKAKAKSQAVAKKRSAREKLLANALAMLLKCAE